MAYLELLGLEKRYDGNPVVQDLTVAVERGDFVSLLGPSGCGKTTTLRMVGGFVTPTQGSIRLAGQAIERRPAHERNMGFVFQNYALFPHMTVLGNVSFGLQMRHTPAAQSRARALEALDMVGLGSLAYRYPSQLSGGQQQRVALARALVIEPDVLLLDEPLSNLDASLRAEMREEISQLQRRLSITTLFVTHDQEEALAMSDTIVVMNQGRVVEVASPRTLSEQPQRAFTAQFLGSRTLLPGGCRWENGQRWFVTQRGLRCPMPSDGGDEATHLVLRASRLQITPAEQDPPPHHLVQVRGTVERVVYIGDGLVCEVATAGEKLRVIQPSSLPEPRIGTAVVVSTDPSGVSWLREPDALAS